MMSFNLEYLTKALVPSTTIFEDQDLNIWIWKGQKHPNLKKLKYFRASETYLNCLVIELLTELKLRSEFSKVRVRGVVSCSCCNLQRVLLLDSVLKVELRVFCDWIVRVADWSQIIFLTLSFNVCIPFLEAGATFRVTGIYFSILHVLFMS